MKVVIFILTTFVFGINSYAANRYWVGTTASWDGTAGLKWAATSGGTGGASVPTSSDDVYFDANSMAVTVTVTGSRNCFNLLFTGFTGTINGGGSLYTYGSITLFASMTFSMTGDVVGLATSSRTITSNGITIPDFTILGVGATYTLSDNFSCTGQIGLNAGSTFNANNFNVTCGSFTSSNFDTRTITMGSGTWTLTGNVNVWDLTTTTNLTLNANTSTIKLLNNSGSFSNAFMGGGKTYNNLWISGTSSQATAMIGSNTFNDLKIDAGRTVYFTAGITTTVSTLTAIGTSGAHITIASPTTSIHTFSKSSGTINAYYCDISYSTATGGSTWNAINSVNNGNNSGWNFINTPTTSASNLTFSNITNNSIKLSWTKGNGQKRIVIAKATSAVNSNPQNGTSYTANSIFGTGSQLGTGNYVVYKDTGSTVTVTGLSLSTGYYFAVIELNGDTGLSTYQNTPYLTGNQITLPVKLIDFKASLKEKNKVLLTWSTASEINNSHFEVERLANNWEMMAKVSGNGTTNTINKYQFIDTTFNHSELNIYYRLKQVDFDGMFDFSKVAVVDLAKNKYDNSFIVYPNPTEGLFTIEFSNANDFKQIQVLDVLGKLIKEISTNDSKANLSLEDNSKGLYLINVKVGESYYHSKILIE